MSTAILHNTFKTTTPFIDATVCETLLLGDYSSLKFFRRVKFSPVINSLLKGTTNSIIHWIKIRAVWGPHVRLDEVDVLFFRLFNIVPRALARRPDEVFICDDGILLGCQTTGPFPGRLDSSRLVGAADLCASTEMILTKFELLHI